MKPLIVRAGLAKTFGGLVTFAAVLLLWAGGYVLVDAFAHPITADGMSLIAGAFALSIAVLLVYFLLHARFRKPARRQKFRMVMELDLPIEEPFPVSRSRPAPEVRGAAAIEDKMREDDQARGMAVK